MPVVAVVMALALRPALHVVAEQHYPRRAEHEREADRLVAAVAAGVDPARAYGEADVVDALDVIDAIELRAHDQTFAAKIALASAP
jgi:hypothetical protein